MDFNSSVPAYARARVRVMPVDLTFRNGKRGCLRKKKPPHKPSRQKSKTLFSEYFLVNNAADVSARDNALNKAHRYVCGILKSARQA